MSLAPLAEDGGSGADQALPASDDQPTQPATPSRVLWLGDRPPAATVTPDTHHRTADGDWAQRRWGEAWVTLPGAATPRAWTPALARLRDGLADQLWLLIPEAALPQWPETRVLGLGLIRAGAVPGYRCYRFSLYDYKHTPDWFGPHQWAHPERFGLEVGADPHPGQETAT